MNYTCNTNYDCNKFKTGDEAVRCAWNMCQRCITNLNGKCLLWEGVSSGPSTQAYVYKPAVIPVRNEYVQQLRPSGINIYSCSANADCNQYKTGNEEVRCSRNLCERCIQTKDNKCRIWENIGN